MDKMLSYRYPRTLIEAFGCDAETAVAIHGPYRKPLAADTWIAVVAVVVCLVGLAVGIVRGIV